VVKKDQLIAVMMPDELRADSAYYARSAEGVGSQVRESEAALRFQERQTIDSIRQAEATLASTQAQLAAAVANLENARLVANRTKNLEQRGIETAQALDQTRTALDAAQAQVDALKKQVDAKPRPSRWPAERRTGLARRSQVQTMLNSRPRTPSARSRCAPRYTEIMRRSTGIVDVKAVRVGRPSRRVSRSSLINPDDPGAPMSKRPTWTACASATAHRPAAVRRQAVDRVRSRRRCRGDAVDVSRTKRDIKTFEVRGWTTAIGWRSDDRLRAAAGALMAAIDVRNIVKKFGDFTAVNGLSPSRRVRSRLAGPERRRQIHAHPMTDAVDADRRHMIINGTISSRRLTGAPIDWRHPQAMTTDLELPENLRSSPSLRACARNDSSFRSPRVRELTQWSKAQAANPSGHEAAGGDRAGPVRTAHLLLIAERPPRPGVEGNVGRCCSGSSFRAAAHDSGDYYHMERPTSSAIASRLSITAISRPSIRR
jgi:hypothetical protein